jgi:hypothetical protein
MSKIGYINKKQVLPEGYAPTDQIDLCSNQISNYKFLIDDNGFVPVLIGKGEIPRVWLFAKQANKQIITLVDDSVSNLAQIKVDIFSSDKRIEIEDTQNEVSILKLAYDQKPIITQIDLRTLGYNVFGDASKLMVGNSSLSGNTFDGVSTVIGFSDSQSKTIAKQA